MATTITTGKLYGMAAELPTAEALFHAAEKMRDHGFKRWDVFSPFPIHGMDDAMGLGKIGGQLHRALLRADRHRHGAAARTGQRALPVPAHRAG